MEDSRKGQDKKRLFSACPPAQPKNPGIHAQHPVKKQREMKQEPGLESAEPQPIKPETRVKSEGGPAISSHPIHREARVKFEGVPVISSQPIRAPASNSHERFIIMILDDEEPAGGAKGNVQSSESGVHMLCARQE
jgi:hypothetical protein